MDWPDRKDASGERFLSTAKKELNPTSSECDYNRAAPENQRLKPDKQRIYEELLVLRFRREDREAFAELVRLWEKRLFYYVRRLVATEEDAWDTLQGVWMKVVTGTSSPGNLPVWLYRIARNTAVSHLRQRYRVQDHLDEGCSVGDIEALEESPCFDDVERVHYGLGEISLAHRTF